MIKRFLRISAIGLLPQALLIAGNFLRPKLSFIARMICLNTTPFPRPDTGFFEGIAFLNHLINRCEGSFDPFPFLDDPRVQTTATTLALAGVATATFTCIYDQIRVSEPERVADVREAARPRAV